MSIYAGDKMVGAGLQIVQGATIDDASSTATDKTWSAKKISDTIDMSKVDAYTKSEADDMFAGKNDTHTHSNKVVLDKLSESDGKLTYNGAGVGSAGGGGMTLIASVADVNTTSKTIEGFDIKVGDRYYFEGYYQTTISGYSKQFVFTNFTVEIHELSQGVKVPFYVLNPTGVLIHSDRNYLSVIFSISTISLVTGESSLTKLNIYKLN